MIHELRTYDLKPRSLDIFADNVKGKLAKRLEYSDLGAFWYTEIGPLNQVVHLWPYRDGLHRSEIRSKVVSDGIWPPQNDDLVIRMQSDIMIPAPYMNPLEEKNYGPIYEMRTYCYNPGEIPIVLDKWASAIIERQKYSPLVGCWYSDVGQLNKLVHIWAYKSYEHRSETRSEVVAKGVWPPKEGIPALTMETKILLPFDFSPLK